MALKLLPTDAYPWPVIVPLFHDAKWNDHEFTAHFKVISKERRQEITANPAADGDAALLEEVVEKWEGLNDLDGNEIPNNPETRALVFGTEQYARAMVYAYLESRDGPAKNSRRRP